MKHLLLLLTIVCLSTEATHAGCTVSKPTGLHSTDITSCSVTMAWDPSAGASYYILWYQLQGSTIPTTVNTGTSTSYLATDLLSKHLYSFKVEAFCSDGTTKGYSAIVKVTTLKCSVVTNITASSITSSSAIISWQFPSPCSGSTFQLHYRVASSQSAWITIQNISTTTQPLASLASGTMYEVQIQSTCNGNVSAWSSSASFQTQVYQATQSRPNILFILEDDGRYDAFAPTGGPSFFQSPAINRIANEGVNFQYMIPATSECSPSRCSFYTGLYPHKHGCTINSTPMTSGLPTVQQILRDHGYYTGFVGKYGVMGYVNNNGTPLGFDWSASSKSEYVNPVFNVNGHNVKYTDGSHYTDVGQKYVLQFLDSVPQNKPFMLFYFTIVPHGPTVPREQEAGMYADETMPFPTNFAKYTTNYPSYLYNNSTLWDADSVATDSMRQNEFESIKGLDYSVDTLFQYLQAKGILDSTIIIFSSDNGYMKGEHMLKGKEIAYEESIRLPLFIRYPKWFTAGTVINDEIASNIDLAPTILEAAGIPDTFHMDGISYHRLATHTVHRKDFLYEFPIGDGLPALRAVRGLQYKYVKSYCTSSTEEFFNLATDPREDSNLIHKSSYASLIQTYRNKLDSLRTAFSDITLGLTVCNLRNPTYKQNDDVDMEQPSLLVFPNPTDQSFTIYLPSSDENKIAEAEVYDLFGRMVAGKSWKGNELNIDCSRWAAGSYVVKVKYEDQTYFSKVAVLSR